MVGNTSPSIIGPSSLPVLVYSTNHTLSSVNDFKAASPASFNMIGLMPDEYCITLDPSIVPVQHSQRMVPIELQEEIEANTQYGKPWHYFYYAHPPVLILSLIYPQKANGSIHVCLDLKDLNKVIICKHHKTSILEEVTYKLDGSKVLSKLDAHNGFWSTHVDYGLSLLTTLNTHLGKYRFLRVPFDLKMSKDIYQI